MMIMLERGKWKVPWGCQGVAVSVRDMGEVLERPYELWLERLSKVYPQDRAVEKDGIWGRDRGNNLGKGIR